MKYIRLFEHIEDRPSVYELVAMSERDVIKLLEVELMKANPNLDLIEDIISYTSIDINYQDEDGWTPLMLSMFSMASKKLVEFFLRQPNINIKLKDKRGQTAWNLASYTIKEEFPELNPDAL